MCHVILLMNDVASQEQIETPNETTATATPVTTQPDRSSMAPSVGEKEDEEVGEEEVTVEMPPPMEEIHTHPIPAAAPQTPSQEDVHARLVSISSPDLISPSPYPYPPTPLPSPLFLDGKGKA